MVTRALFVKNNDITRYDECIFYTQYGFTTALKLNKKIIQSSL